MYFRIFFSMNWCYDPVWEFKTGFKSWSFCEGRVGKKNPDSDRTGFMYYWFSYSQVRKLSVTLSVSIYVSKWRDNTYCSV